MESRPTRILAAAAAALLVLAGAGWAQGPDPDRHIVKFRDGKGAQGLAALRGANAEVLLQLAPQNAAAARIPSHALAGLRQNPNIEYIEVDPPRYPLAQSTPYGIKMVQADPDTGGLAPGSSARKVCIIDSGYSIDHEDLKSGAGVTGYPSGWDNDTCFHGTHVAGTVSAMDNTVGVVGVMPGNSAIQLHIVQVFDGADCGWSYASTLVDASNRCADAGANVISMSLGCNGNRCRSSTEQSAFDTHYANGILSVAAAGNSGNTQKSYPASYSSVVSVAAVDSAGVVASFSQQNDAVEIAAPGVAVRSTVGMGAGKEESLSVAGTGYEAIAMDGSPNATSSGPLVDCGLGTSACPGGGGQVCLISRGDISFADKVLACEAGGGVGAVIYNNLAGLFSGTLGETATTIPSVGISQEDGLFLKANQLGSSSTVSVAQGNYAYYDGTSMATPHVSGVAALVWSQNTAWTNADLRSAFQNSAIDLGAAGKDNAYGYGLIQAQAAYDLLLSGGGGGGGGDDGGDGGGGSCELGQPGDPCSGNGDCCSNKCTGKPGAKTCK